MATVALNVVQKEQLKTSSKFSAMIRSGAYSKANYWINTVDPGTVGTLPGGIGNTATYTRWRKSLSQAIQIFQNPSSPEGNPNFVNLFLQNLTQAVWDNAVGFNADTVILNMEANAATMIDPAMDATFDAIIKYSDI